MKKEKMANWIRGIFIICLVLGGFFLKTSDAKARSASEPYKVGLSATVTGPAAGTYTSLSDGFRLYIEVLNEKGGVNGRKIKLIFEDNAGQGVKGGASIKRFVGAKANFIELSAPSGVYAPAFAEVKRANIPVLVLGIGPMQTVPPKAEPLVYGQAHANAINASKIIVRIVKEQFASKVKNPVWGIVGVDIPVARKGTEVQGKIGAKMGMTTLVKIAPLGMTDYTSIATAMMDAKCNIASTFGPAGLTMGFFRALSKLGYRGSLYINTPDPPETFIELMTEHPSIIYSSPQMSPLSYDLPVHKEIIAAAERHGVRINSLIKLGWWHGMILEEVFKRAGWPVTTEKLVDILDRLDLDFGPGFAPVRFTPTDHQGPLYESGWSWRAKEGTFVPALPWYVSNAAGTMTKVFPKSIEFPKFKFR